MVTRALRLFTAVATFVFFLALAGCGGSKTVICPLTSSNSSCGCGALGGAAGVPACPAPAYVYANGPSGSVSTFPVDSITRAVGSPTTVTGPQFSLGMAALNNSFLYVSDFQTGVGTTGLIDGWSINPTTGALAALPGSPFSLGPLSVGAGLAMNTTVQVLYVGDAGKIDALKVDATGALSPIAGSPFPAGINLFLTVDPLNHYLFAADDTPPGNVEAFSVDLATGGLTPVPGSPFPIGTGTTSPLLVGILVDSTSSFVYTLEGGANQVAAFSIAPSTGVLTAVPGSPFPVGSLPMSMATTSNQLLYVANVGDGTVSGFRIDPTSGALAPLAGSPFPIDATALTTDPGRFYLYAAGPLGLTTFSIDTSTGALTQVGTPQPIATATVLSFVQ